MMELNRKCVPQCETELGVCDYNKEGFCEKFLCPEAKFRGQLSCGMATHIKMEVKEEKKRVGQQKQIKKKTK